jgi:hypothetical protein
VNVGQSLGLALLHAQAGKASAEKSVAILHGIHSVDEENENKVVFTNPVWNLKTQV